MGTRQRCTELSGVPALVLDSKNEPEKLDIASAVFANAPARVTFRVLLERPRKTLRSIPAKYRCQTDHFSTRCLGREVIPIAKW